MATFTVHPRNNSSIRAFQWHTVDGEQLPYVKFFAAGNYFYFDNQKATDNTFPIHDGDWIVGENPLGTNFSVMSDSDFRFNFAP
jgi:hypothetical protein